MKEHGGSLITLDFDNSTQAWPKYDWMGVSKAALESVTRYLARDLGRYKIRVNAICAGPLATLAASGIPGFKDFEEVWENRAPLGWSLQDKSPVGRAARWLRPTRGARMRPGTRSRCRPLAISPRHRAHGLRTSRPQSRAVQRQFSHRGARSSRTL